MRSYATDFFIVNVNDDTYTSSSNYLLDIKPGTDYNLSKTERYLFTQAASSIKTYILAKQLSPGIAYDLFTDERIFISHDKQMEIDKYYYQREDTTDNGMIVEPIIKEVFK